MGLHTSKFFCNTVRLKNMWSYTPICLYYVVPHHPHKVHKVCHIVSVYRMGRESSTGPDSQKVNKSVTREVIYIYIYIYMAPHHWMTCVWHFETACLSHLLRDEMLTILRERWRVLRRIILLLWHSNWPESTIWINTTLPEPNVLQTDSVNY